MTWNEVMELSLEQLECILAAAARHQRQLATLTGAAVAAAQAGGQAWRKFLDSLGD